MAAVLLPKESRGDAVSISLSFPHGTETTLKGRRIAAEFAGHMLLRSTIRRSRQEFNDEFVRLKIQGNLNGGVFGIDGSLTTVRGNLPDVLRLVAEMLREPAFDPAEFELLREAFLANVEAPRSFDRREARTPCDRRRPLESSGAGGSCGSCLR